MQSVILSGSDNKLGLTDGTDLGAVWSLRRRLWQRKLDHVLERQLILHTNTQGCQLKALLVNVFLTFFSKI